MGLGSPDPESLHLDLQRHHAAAASVKARSRAWVPLPPSQALVCAAPDSTIRSHDAHPAVAGTVVIKRPELSGTPPLSRVAARGAGGRRCTPGCTGRR